MFNAELQQIFKLLDALVGIVTAEIDIIEIIG
jgi:hypothetical protein